MYIYICMYVYIWDCVTIQGHIHWFWLAWHSNELMSPCVIMISSDFWALGVPSAIWVPITALISGRAIVCLDPNLWGRLAYFMNNPNCTPKYHPGSSSLEITSNQELQRQRSCGSSFGTCPSCGDVSWCFWDFDRSMGSFPAMFDDTYPTPKSGIEGRRHA
jgi:hypothetical protein